MKRESRLFINDILESIKLIEKYLENIPKEKFISNVELQDSVLRRLEIIGEAVKNLPNYLKEKYPEIPWRDISGFRDVVTHAYFSVVLERIWKIIKQDLPDLKQKILKIKKDLENKEK